MGIFSALFGGDKPEYKAPEVPTLQTGGQLYDQALGFGKENMPLALGARESAIMDLGRGNEYYAGYQPTSIESALQAQNFANIWPDQEAYMKNLFSQSGMAYSPAMATSIGNARSGLMNSIAQYLTNLGNERARYSLNSRLGIDPMSQILTPYADLTGLQDRSQGEFTWQGNKAKSDADYSNAMQKYQSKNAMIDAIGSLALGAIGGIAGGMGGLAGLPGVGTGISGALSGFSLGSSLGQGDFGSIASTLTMGGLLDKLNSLKSGVTNVYKPTSFQNSGFSLKGAVA